MNINRVALLVSTIVISLLALVLGQLGRFGAFDHLQSASRPEVYETWMTLSHANRIALSSTVSLAILAFIYHLGRHGDKNGIHYFDVFRTTLVPVALCASFTTLVRDTLAPLSGGLLFIALLVFAASTPPALAVSYLAASLIDSRMSGIAKKKWLISLNHWLHGQASQLFDSSRQRQGQIKQDTAPVKSAVMIIGWICAVLPPLLILRDLNLLTSNKPVIIVASCSVFGLYLNTLWTATEHEYSRGRWIRFLMTMLLLATLGVGSTYALINGLWIGQPMKVQ